MRSAVVTLLFVLFALLGHSQEWSDKAQYDAYMKGDWQQVIELGKLARKAGADYYYIRVRNGYANYQLGRFHQAEKEFEKALEFNSGDVFSKRYSYWSSYYAGNVSTALVKSGQMSPPEQDTIQVIKPKFFTAISALGGYRVSTSQNFVGNMPYVSAYLDHQIGKRITLHHGVSYLNQTRTSFINRLNSTVWQVGYLATVGIQVAKHTTIAPSFVMQYWQTDGFKVYDLSATLAVRQQFGNMNTTLIGGYFQDTDTTKYMVGGSFTWYPLHNLKLYSITSGGYNFGGAAPNPFVKQTIGGQLFKKVWLSSSFNWNHQVLVFEDIGLDFANNSVDRLNWKWSLSPVFYPLPKLALSLTYSIESRQYYRLGELGIANISDPYNFHSFYVGLNYNF
ncbi:MAG: tetratricopeptide repeat protein [Flavobacteriales bacterium]|nr:tetratricopeptide repeat protein [Flavobacteriales bacterium]